MDYFDAVQQGKARVKKSVDALAKIAGASYPMLFLKTGREGWEPVGDEDLFAMVAGKNDTVAAVFCDSEGNAKAISGWLSRVEAESVSNMLSSSGLKKYVGEVKLPI